MRTPESLESLFTETHPLQIKKGLKAETATNAVFNPLPTERGTDLPARFLAGFIPAIGIVDSFTEQQPNGKHILRVFVPINISSFVNEPDPEQTRKLMDLGVNAVRMFIEKFHPTTSFFTQTDKPVSDERMHVLAEISQLIDPNSNAFQRVARFSQGHGGERQDPRLYIADHLFGWQDLIDQNCYGSEELGATATVINCLPPSDKPFLDIRKQVLNALCSDSSLIHRGHHIDLITRASRTPHYIVIGNEPTLGQIRDEPSGVQWALTEFDKIINSETDSGRRNSLKQAKKDFSRVVGHFDFFQQTSPAPSFKEFVQELFIQTNI